MTIQNIEGKEVTVVTAFGRLRRIVAFDLGDTVVLATKGQYEAVVSTGIGQFSIAFKKADVLVDTAVSLKHNVQYEQAEHGQAGPDRQGAGGGQ
jgi:hypothetical protein